MSKLNETWQPRPNATGASPDNPPRNNPAVYTVTACLTRPETVQEVLDDLEIDHSPTLSEIAEMDHLDRLRFLDACFPPGAALFRMMPTDITIVLNKGDVLNMTIKKTL